MKLIVILREEKVASALLELDKIKASRNNIRKNSLRVLFSYNNHKGGRYMTSF